VAAKGG